jgi:2'-5' RNA ligase
MTTEVPGLPRIQDALSQAQGLLDEDEGNQFTVDPASLVPNPLQGLWIVSFSAPDGARLDGGGIAVDASGARYLTSAPSAPEYVGALFEEDEDDPSDEAEIEALLETEPEIKGALARFGSAPRGTFAPGDDYDETVCIMAIPADPEALPGPEDKHATLHYFGKRSEHEDPERMESAKGLLLEVLKIAAQETPPFTARVTGVEPLGDEGAQGWLLDSPDLQRLFEEIPEIDSEIQSLYEGAEATRYPEYKPHVTIGYGSPDVDTDEATEKGLVSDDNLDEARQVEEIAFDRLSLWWGDEHIDIPLGAGEFDALIERFGT